MREMMSENKTLFQIGEVARMFHVSPGTLRHYEEAGILMPEYVDEQTGYRYYSIRQFEVLNTIRYLRVLDLPLKQIADYLQNRNIDNIWKKLKQQQELIDRKQRELEIVRKKIEHRLQHIEDARNSTLDQIEWKMIHEMRIVRISASLKPHSYLDLEYSIRQLEEGQKDSLVFLGKVGLGISEENLMKQQYESYDRVFLILDEEDTFQGEIERIPAGICVVIRFRGSHGEAPGYYRRLLDYMEEHRLRFHGFSREITLIDEGMTNDPEKFVTEIQIPIKCEEESV